VRRRPRTRDRPAIFVAVSQMLTPEKDRFQSKTYARVMYTCVHTVGTPADRINNVTSVVRTRGGTSTGVCTPNSRVARCGANSFRYASMEHNRVHVMIMRKSTTIIKLFARACVRVRRDSSVTSVRKIFVAWRRITGK